MSRQAHAEHQVRRQDFTPIGPHPFARRHRGERFPPRLEEESWPTSRRTATGQAGAQHQLVLAHGLPAVRTDRRQANSRLSRHRPAMNDRRRTRRFLLRAVGKRGEQIISGTIVGYAFPPRAPGVIADVPTARAVWTTMASGPGYCPGNTPGHLQAGDALDGR